MFYRLSTDYVGIGQHSDLSLMRRRLLVHDFGMLFCYE